MNIAEHVMLTSESGYYVPPRYLVMDASVGGTLGATTVWLKCISYGLETETDFDDYANSLLVSGSQIADKSKLAGTLNAYSVVTLADIAAYNKGFVKNMQTSPYPVG